MATQCCASPTEPVVAKNAATGIPPTADIIEWLASDDCHETDDVGLAAGLGRRLTDAGLPVDRLTLHLRTLHPEILGCTVAWAPGEPVEIRDREHGIEVSAGFAGSPLRRVMETRVPLTVHLDAASDPDWAHTDLFEGRGLIDFVVFPLCNADGLVSAASFSTARTDGFSDRERAALERLVPALRNACELRTLRKVELTLLDTYVGTATARRVLAGRIRRGQVESLEAALMLCDLRGFTALSNRLSDAAILELLNAYFDRVVPAIGRAGGEVVKFMGDAVLGFFRRDDAGEACAACLRSAVDILESLDRFVIHGAELRTGIALHFGKVGYGNIGSGQRLDFTVIGPDVNLVSRIQSVCSETGRPLLMSKRFAMLLPTGYIVPAGSHVLRGFPEPAELYALSRGARSRIQ